jgi:hypothetical protein
MVIDERADARQRDALAKILTGQETLVDRIKRFEPSASRRTP